MCYKVYTAEYHGMPRNHIAIFVQTGEGDDGDGYLYHVIGNIQTGMTYNKRPDKNPKKEITHVPDTQKCIGSVKKADMSRFDTICESVSPPAKQMVLSKRIDPSKPLRRCTEWVAEAIEKLLEEGVASTSISDRDAVNSR